MTSQQRKKALELISNPPRGSKIAAAKEYGIDLTLLFENLQLTPTERVARLCDAAASMELVRQAGQRLRPKK